MVEAENIRRHAGISFDDAIVALRDRFATRWFDESHSGEDPRFVTIGRDIKGRFLAVVASEKWPKPRIISAWRASKRERDAYQRRR